MPFRMRAQLFVDALVASISRLPSTLGSRCYGDGSSRPSRRCIFLSRRSKILSSCVTTRTAACRSNAAARSSSITASARSESSAAVGSSARMMRGVVCERAGDGDPLRLAAGELCGHGLAPVRHLQIVEKLERASLRGSGRIAQKRSHDRDVLPGVEKRQQIMGLEDEADLLEPQPAQVLALPFAVLDFFPIEPHAFRPIGSRMQPTRLRSVLLPDPLGPQQPHDLSGVNIEIDAGQRVHAGRRLRRNACRCRAARRGRVVPHVSCSTPRPGRSSTRRARR